MEETLKKIKKMLCDELKEIAETKVTASSIDIIDKLTHSLKSVETILAMQESGYSNTYPYYDHGYSRDDRKERLIRELRSLLDDNTSTASRMKK